MMVSTKIKQELKKQLLKELSTMQPNDAAEMIEIYYNTLDEISKEFYNNWTYCANCKKYVKNEPVLLYDDYEKFTALCPECGGIWRFGVIEYR